MTALKIFITCPRGLESVLVDELNALSLQYIHTVDGGVDCTGSWKQVYQINLHSRVASRVLVELVRGACPREDAAYQLALKVNWADWFDVNDLIKVNVTGKKTPFNRIDILGLKVKDAVCDVFREKTGKRPSVDKTFPDVRIHMFVEGTQARLMLDTSGEALFKRGYRDDTGEAPLRENLAAGLLLLAGYDGSQAFYDPMCGSGTIAIEAALIAKNQAPGLYRHYGFEKLKGFDKALWATIKQNALQAVTDVVSPLKASDVDRRVLKTALNNAHQAGVDDLIVFNVQDMAQATAPAAEGIVVSNPPYGIRLEDEHFLRGFYPQLGSVLKQQFSGWKVALITADRTLPTGVRLKPARKIPLFNGKLDCRLFVFDMVKGSNRGD
ncbi:ribosomal RNA large subunit methyltransferase L [Vitreoscilla sp. C1]|uniref:THUMP domain-containing class I SAM-dependent RNA methyltransferase n=1 Tax=Vitreoscilla sp. (strain C1) TaxID=96942 RepID=UPI000CDBF863|nr:class I SAM-dependent RNA methyltransferase [Vitreoscilla sp. C1]AUZ05921.1 ribosomal RNA large subunit methyltransferase L [Vitreoscilla sp. C1]